MIPLEPFPRPRPAPNHQSRAWWLLGALALLGLACVVLSPPGFVGPQRPVPARPDATVLPAVPAAVDLPKGPAGPPGADSGPTPQFVVLSFDGAGSVDLWQHWRDVGGRDHAHFTFFLSGAYLLTPANAADYHAPRHRVGASDIGNLPTPGGTDPGAYLRALLGQIGDGYREGHEVASHFNGHFCSPRPGSVGSWNAEDWAAELEQFSGLLAGASQNNQLQPPVPLPFVASQVIGTRTPCLEGQFDVLYPVLARRGFRYDASQSAREGSWPERKMGVWSFPLAAIPLAGRNVRVLSMDYNLYVNQSGAKDVPAPRARVLEEQAYTTFIGYFERSYSGNRAPLSIGAHFTRWNDSAYVNALTRFVHDVCGRPEVRCVSFRELADWLDARAAAQAAAVVSSPPRRTSWARSRR